MRWLLACAILTLAVLVWWPARATPYTHRLMLAGGETAHVECAEDALRVDRLQDEPLAVVLVCYEERTPSPGNGNGQWLKVTK